MRYFFHIAYLGSRYSGWQKHPRVLNVQQVLENALSRILKTPVAIVGCGRTDAGVHASQYFFHTDIENEWDFDLFFRLNKVLPDDIAVFEIIPMQGLCHARYDAVQRSYDYFLHTYKDPFLSRFSSFYLKEDLNFDRMQAAAALLPKYNDYRGFCTSPDRNDHTLCYVSSAGLFADASGDKFRFRITANRFLSKMIRIITGRLLDIGEGRMSVDEFEQHLINKTTPPVIIPAHPQGLYLSKVTYPYLDLAPRSAFTSSLQSIADTDWKPV